MNINKDRKDDIEYEIRTCCYQKRVSREWNILLEIKIMIAEMKNLIEGFRR